VSVGTVWGYPGLRCGLKRALAASRLLPAVGALASAGRWSSAGPSPPLVVLSTRMTGCAMRAKLHAIVTERLEW